MAKKPIESWREIPPPIADRAQLNRIMDEIEERMGFVPDPDATHEKLREMMKEEGIRPEDNIFSRDIIRMRNGEPEE